MLWAPLPSPTVSRFLTVKEAAHITGKSPSSIRRVIYPIIHDDGHPDRTHIQPSIKDVTQLRLKGENFAWRLSEELLRREVPVEAAGATSTPRASAHAPGGAEGELLAMVRGELQIKNQQLAQQSELLAKQLELINGLSERVREGNVLVATLQQQLALPEGRGTQPVTVRMKRPSSTPPQKGSTISHKPAKPKRGFLSRMFG